MNLLNTQLLSGDFSSCCRPSNPAALQINPNIIHVLVSDDLEEVTIVVVADVRL